MGENQRRLNKIIEKKYCIVAWSINERQLINWVINRKTQFKELNVKKNSKRGYLSRKFRKSFKNLWNTSINEHDFE